MVRSSISRLSPFAVAAMVLGLGAQTALADTPSSQSGTTGKHSLTDTSTSPGATCNYKHKYPGTHGKLVEIVVQPPNMRAVAGKSQQVVGWQFEVQRRTQGEGGAFPWQHRYTSPEMTTTADDIHNATFTTASVPVKAGPRLAGGRFQYRVFVMMTWYRSDSSVQGTARDRVDYYVEIQDIGGTVSRGRDCNDWEFFG